jgi:hypothetical protein
MERRPPILAPPVCEEQFTLDPAEGFLKRNDIFILKNHERNKVRSGDGAERAACIAPQCLTSACSMIEKNVNHRGYESDHRNDGRPAR